MLSRVLRATPKIASAAASRRAMHASAVRADLIQDIYSQEISAFKPKILTEKDAEGSVLKWATPVAPKVPAEELNVSEIDSYTSEPVEVDTVSASESGEAEPVGDDWFPIESCDELDAGH